MMSKFYPMKTLTVFLFLLGMVSGTYSQTLELNKTVDNVTTGLSGLTAEQNQILQYTIVARNLGGTNITSSRLFDNIPAGVTYVTGSTTLNGASVADVSGKMPYAGTGGLINSPLYDPGILAPNVSATITFQVRITANGGNVTNYGTLQGIHSSGTTITQNTNTVFTNLTPDAQCSTIYESTATQQSGTPSFYLYKVIRTMSTTNGKALTTVFDATIGACYNAIDGSALATGSVLRYASAIAYHKTSNRIYFINNYRNNPPEDLCYIDLNYSPARAYQYVGYPLEPNTATGYNINRMAFASDGYGYAITSNGEDLVRFYVDPGTNLPVITQLGPLIDDVNNGSHEVLDEGGGDIFADGSGMLYMVVNSSNLYKINPNTRVATYLGTLNPTPGSSSNSIAIDATGAVYIGGAYQNVYRVNLATMAATSILSGSTPTSGVYTNGDFTSCAFPVLAPALTVNKTYSNINGSPFILGGDTVEYTIEVTNTGNINAANVKLYDSIPSSSLYIANSTRLNGSSVADVMGVMPYSVTGGRLINSPGESGGIIRPGSTYKATVTFRIKVDPLHYICNQSMITLLDGDGNAIFINSDDPTQGGSQNSTCFFTDGVLPVNNLRFRGSLNKDLSVLQWTGSNEENVASYEVQFSENGTHYMPLASVAVKDNGHLNNNYEFTDRTNTMVGIRFYRLKITQKGGSASYSAIIRLNLKTADIQIQPNPFDKELNLQFQLKTTEPVRIRLIDFTGREVYTTTEKLSLGYHSLTLTLPSGLSKGMYVLELLVGNNQVFQKKLLKR
jgi:uncharacterized repeat protein (TIGR01451 family)